MGDLLGTPTNMGIWVGITRYDIDGPFNDVRRTYPQNIDIYIYIYIIAMFNYQRDPEGMILPQMDFSCNWKPSTHPSTRFQAPCTEKKGLSEVYPRIWWFFSSFSHSERWPQLGLDLSFFCHSQTYLSIASWLTYSMIKLPFSMVLPRWILYFWWPVVALQAAKPWIGPIRAKPNAAQSWAYQLGMERIFAGMGQYL